MTACQFIRAARLGASLAPPTVYRVLGRLIEEGLAHRLESINAFVACRMPPRHRGRTVFMPCRDGGTAKEMIDEPLTEHLRQCAAARRFQIEKATLELHGRCAACVSLEEGRA